MNVVTYTIELLEPLLATALDGDPNSAVSYPYIPGSLIRGLVAGKLHSSSSDLAIDTKARTRLFSGEVRYLNAYYSRDGKERPLPAPVSWHRPKHRSEEVWETLYDLAVLTDSDIMTLEAKGVEPSAGIGGYLPVGGQSVVLHEPQRQITIHTLRNRNSGRPDEREGTVYRYDALASGQRFAGAIIVPNQEIADEMVSLLKDRTYRLGGARTAGYGLLRFVNASTISDDEWSETDIEIDEDIEAGDTLTITLLSDTILRDENGSPHTDLTSALIDFWHMPANALVMQRAFVKATLVGGFNRKWGLPLQQDLATAAGSVVVLKAQNTVTVGDLQRLSDEGIGERRSEGFGRIGINWQQRQRSTLRSIPPGNSVPDLPNKPQLTGDLLASAKLMATRRRRQALDLRLRTAILSIGNELDVSSLPASTQLARVRVFIRSALKDRDRARILSLFTPNQLDPDDGNTNENPHALPKRALDQFRRTRLTTGKRLIQWITDLLQEDSTQIWEILGDTEAKTLVDAAPEGWMAEEYTLRLIDGVLAQAMQRNQ